MLDKVIDSKVLLNFVSEKQNTEGLEWKKFRFYKKAKIINNYDKTGAL